MNLRSKGVGIIYISHRLGEVRKLADRVLVLRDGQNAGELSRKEITHDNMVKLMVGREISQFYMRAGLIKPVNRCCRPKTLSLPRGPGID